LILVDNLEISPEYINEARNNNGDTCANIGFAYHVGKKKKKKKKKTILKPWHGTN
jgi:hypothetical protein